MAQNYIASRLDRRGVSNVFIIVVATISLVLGYYTAKFCAVYFFGYHDKVKQRKATLQEQIDAAQILVDYAIDNFDRIVGGKITESEVVSYRKDVYWPVFFILRPADSDGNRGSINEGAFCQTLGLGVYLGFIMDPEQQDFIEEYNSFRKRFGFTKDDTVEKSLTSSIKTAIAEIRLESLELNKIGDQRPQEVSLEDQIEAARDLVNYAVNNRVSVESGTVTESEAIYYFNEVYWPVFDTLRPMDSDGNCESTTEGSFVKTLELGLYLGTIMTPDLQEIISNINELNRKLNRFDKNPVHDELSEKIDSALKEIKVESGETDDQQEDTKKVESASPKAETHKDELISASEPISPTDTSDDGIKVQKPNEKQADTQDQFQLAMSYYNGDKGEQNYAKAFNLFLAAANQGNIEAQRMAGVCYMLGHGIEFSSTEAVNWFLKAADQGDRESQYFLGLCYEEGDGVEKDVNEAMKWYQRAAEQGDAEAKEKLQQMKSKR